MVWQVEGRVWPGGGVSWCYQSLRGCLCPFFFTEVFSWRAGVMTVEPEDILTSFPGHMLWMHPCLLSCLLLSQTIHRGELI